MSEERRDDVLTSPLTRTVGGVEVEVRELFHSPHGPGYTRTPVGLISIVPGKGNGGRGEVGEQDRRHTSGW